jgi:hypothetical protein
LFSTIGQSDSRRVTRRREIPFDGQTVVQLSCFLFLPWPYDTLSDSAGADSSYYYALTVNNYAGGTGTVDFLARLGGRFSKSPSRATKPSDNLASRCSTV